MNRIQIWYQFIAHGIEFVSPQKKLWTFFHSLGELWFSQQICPILQGVPFVWIWLIMLNSPNKFSMTLDLRCTSISALLVNRAWCFFFTRVPRIYFPWGLEFDDAWDKKISNYQELRGTNALYVDYSIWLVGYHIY